MSEIKKMIVEVEIEAHEFERFQKHLEAFRENKKIPEFLKKKKNPQWCELSFETNHVPGPWIQVGGRVEVEDDSIPDICTCYPVDINQHHLEFDIKTILANARLIAAAPEMLATLIGLMNLCILPSEDEDRLMEVIQSAI